MVGLMDHGVERSETPLGSSGPLSAGGPGTSRWATWSRVCVDVSDRGEVLGYSVEVHSPDSLEAIHVFPCGPFDDPPAVFALAIEWLRETYGEQLSLSLF